MKKIPTVFKRAYENRKIVDILDEITPGCEEAFKNGVATIKIDGSCCAIIDGIFYKRFDAKKGRKIPEGAIPCCEPDPITGHHPHWVKVDENKPEDKWFVEAIKNQPYFIPEDGTYEAVGPHFQGNPYDLEQDEIVKHGIFNINIDRTFESVREYLKNNNFEGLVFWLNGEPVCKIKRSDFGYEWPVKKKGENHE